VHIVSAAISTPFTIRSSDSRDLGTSWVVQVRVTNSGDVAVLLVDTPYSHTTYEASACEATWSQTEKNGLAPYDWNPTVVPLAPGQRCLRRWKALLPNTDASCKEWRIDAEVAFVIADESTAVALRADDAWEFMQKHELSAKSDSIILR
jgi:hypothetical protein